VKIIILIFFIFSSFSLSNPINKKITLQLSWFNQFQFAGYYIAKEKGFYKDVGLDVTIKPFEFGIDIPKEVNNGKFDFAVGRETLILEKTNHKNLVSLYALFQASPLILISTKESKINDIKDFNNKKIMTTIDDASEVSIKSMITSQNMDIKNLNFIKHTHNINDLIEKKTDVISAYTSKSPYHLQKMNIPYNVFAPKDYGFDMYSDLLYTNESMIKNDLEAVLEFKEASLKGWEYAYSNIEETANLILKKYNQQKLTKEELIFEGNELKKLSYYQTERLGEIDLNKLQRIYDLYNVMGLVKNKIDIKDFVYIENNFNQFIKNTFKNLYKYIELPYIYFFISLFFILIILIIYKQTKLYILSHELSKKNVQLRDLAERDHLTKLYNRRSFETIAKEQMALAQREKENTAILIIDIDNFKSINDTYGHHIGDIVLCSLADLMTQYKRESDVVVRYGGEEFLILLPNTSLTGAKHYSEMLKKEIEQTVIETKERDLKITVSMGLTMVTLKDNIQSAVNRADKGLYISKNNGKNQLNIA